MFKNIIAETEKAVILSIVREDKIKVISEVLTEKFDKVKEGKGIASKLIKPMLAFCDLEQMVCYLETNKEKNLSLYKHYGFELMEEQFVPSSNVIHYSISRQHNKIK